VSWNRGCCDKVVLQSRSACFNGHVVEDYVPELRRKDKSLNRAPHRTKATASEQLVDVVNRYELGVEEEESSPQVLQRRIAEREGPHGGD